MESSIYKRLIVNECPDMPLMKNVTKNKVILKQFKKQFKKQFILLYTSVAK